MRKSNFRRCYQCNKSISKYSKMCRHCHTTYTSKSICNKNLSDIFKNADCHINFINVRYDIEYKWLNRLIKKDIQNDKLKIKLIYNKEKLIVNDMPSRTTHRPL